MYSKNLSIRYIAKELGITPHTVRKELVKLNIPITSRIESITKYKVNCNYFDCINSPDKAYFLGWIYSDGSISGRQLRMSLKHDNDNFEILEKLNSYIKSNRPLKVYADKTGYEKVSLSISNVKILNDLRNIGLTGNKTYNCTFPSIKNELLPYFIRGFFDGDGSIFRNKKRYLITFVGTEEFLEVLKSVLYEKNIFSKLSSEYCDSKCKVKRLAIHRVNSIKQFYKYVFSENKEMCLKRKYLRFQEFFQHRNFVENERCEKCQNLVFKNHLCHKHLFEKKRLNNPNYTRSNNVDIDVLKRLLQEGKTQRYIAKYFKVSPSAINKIIKLRELH